MPRVKKEKEEKQETKQEAEPTFREEKVEVKEEVCGCPPKKEKKPKVKKEKKEEVCGCPHKKEKKPRKPSEYATFVKQFYHTKEIMDLPSKERFKKISVLWKKQKETKKTSQ